MTTICHMYVISMHEKAELSISKFVAMTRANRSDRWPRVISWLHILPLTISLIARY